MAKKPLKKLAYKQTFLRPLLTAPFAALGGGLGAAGAAGTAAAGRAAGWSARRIGAPMLRMAGASPGAALATGLGVAFLPSVLKEGVGSATDRATVQGAQRTISQMRPMTTMSKLPQHRPMMPAPSQFKTAGAVDTESVQRLQTISRVLGMQKEAAKKTKALRSIFRMKPAARKARREALKKRRFGYDLEMTRRRREAKSLGSETRRQLTVLGDRGMPRSGRIGQVLRSAGTGNVRRGRLRRGSGFAGSSTEATEAASRRGGTPIRSVRYRGPRGQEAGAAGGPPPPPNAGRGTSATSGGGGLGQQDTDRTLGQRIRANLPQALAIAGALTATGAVFGLGEDAVRSGVGEVKERVRLAGSNRRFKNMLKADPTLKREPRARQMFGVLDRMAPFVSTEPVLAASTVRSMVSAPTVDRSETGLPMQDPNRLRVLMDLQRSRQDTRFPGIQRSAAPRAMPAVKDIPGFGE